MEALSLSVRRLPLRSKGRSPERELQDLRPLGEAYVMRRFGTSLNRADAEDAVADVVMRMHKRIESGRAPNNLRAAFFTSVRNAAIDQLRSRNAKPTVALEAVADAPSEDLSPIERAESHEDSVRLQEALARMRGNYRETILLRFGVGMTVPEIAERLEISLPAAKKLVLRATEQARKRLTAIEGADYCPEMQDLARRAVMDEEAAGLADEAEHRILRAHVDHCGSCKTFLAELHRNLHELGSTMLIAGTTGVGVDRHVGIAEHLGRWFEQASETAQAAGSRVRIAAYQASGTFQSGDGVTAGALGTTAQKVAAVCGAATATAATCVATGVIGPGLGGAALPNADQESHARHDAIVKEIETSPSTETPSVPTEDASPAEEHSPEAPGANETQTSTPEIVEPEPEPSPSAQASEEFGFESSAQPEAAPEPAPAPPPPPPAPSGASGSGGGGGGGSGESFGFGG
jgi:RNA polymerase sigma factor (sigma-70 family)